MRSARVSSIVALTLGAVAFMAALTLDWYTVAITPTIYRYSSDDVSGAVVSLNAVDSYYFPMIYALGMLALFGVAGVAAGRPSSAARFAGFGLAGGVLALVVAILVRTPAETVAGQLGGPGYEVITTWRAGAACAVAGVVLPALAIGLAGWRRSAVAPPPPAPAPAAVADADVIDLSVRGL